MLSLFYFLGSFEVGLSEQALKSIWPSNVQLDEHIFLLQRLGVLENFAPRLTVNPLLAKFVK